MIPVRVSSFLLIFVSILLLLSTGSNVSGVWQCKEKKECEANFSAPAHPRRLAEALLYKPMAEYDFHYNCISEVEAETIDEIKLETRRAGFAKRFHDNDGKYENLEDCEDAKKMLPGIKEMMFGYNVVSDKYSKETGHLQVLDVTSRSEFGATVEDPLGLDGDSGTPICYKVPDAFVSQGTSIIFTSDSSRDFKATGGTSAESYRKTKMEAKMSELGVDGSGSYAGVTLSAGLTTSESNSNFVEMGGTEESTRDASSIEYVEEVFEATIETPEPSKQLLNRWRNLAKLNSSTADQIQHAFKQYFDEAGTHYYLSAMLGGRFTLQYVSKTRAKKSDKKEAQSRAKCVAGKVGLSFMGIGGSVAKKDCDTLETSSSKESSGSDYMEELRTHCRGGDAGKCPASTDKEQSREDFKDWQKSLRRLPAPIHGRKRWITSLIDHILQSYGGTGHESKIYERIIKEFGDVNDNVEQASNRLKEFRDKLDEHLLLYLENAHKAHIKKFNGTGDGGKPNVGGIGAWHLAEGVELINPKSHLGWHSYTNAHWGPMERCPPGEFAKAAAIDIQVRKYEDPKDWTGLQKIHLFCTNGKGIASKFLNHGQTSKQVSCPGYLIGYRMRAHQIQGINSGDNRGATNIEYRCMVEGSGDIRTLKMVVECKRDGWDEKQVKRCEDEQKLGDWGEWLNCPDKFGIAGIKTRLHDWVGPHVDDAAILDVGYWCNQLPENGLTAAPPNTTAIPCQRQTDLVIALDTSTSILPTDFEIGCDFAARLAGAFLAPSRISFIAFSAQATVAIPIDSGLSSENIHGKIKFFTRTMVGTRTDLAINEAIQQLHNPRPGVPRKLVVITDGVSNQPQLTEESANNAKEKGIHLFSVGIGTQAGPEELMLLAGGDKDRRFSVDDFDKLLQIIAPVSVEVCDSN